MPSHAMHSIHPHATTTLCLAITLSLGCDGEKGHTDHAEKIVHEHQLPVPTGGVLATGYAVWRAVCRDCHVTGLGEAPRITDAVAWKPRLKLGRQTLYQSAIHGVIRTTEEGMPPKGEDYDRPDDEIRAAVDYILYATFRTPPPSPTTSDQGQTEP